MIDPTAIPMYKPEEIEPKWQACWMKTSFMSPMLLRIKQSFTSLPCFLIHPVIYTLAIGMP